ncbi:MAG TPA: hypothetical protein VFP84_01610 [Kofleriaceae bacterium]|nr:hypothetical protein [Kofleriaceae bacterium]
MVRLSAGAILMIAAVGCTGLIGGGSDGKSDQQHQAASSWEDGAYPALKQACAVCHAGARPGVEFLDGSNADEVKATLLAYSPAVVDFDAPASSRILSKGAHEGPELTADQSTALLQWLQDEKDAQAHDPAHPIKTYKVPAFTPTLCPAGTADTACPVNKVMLSAADPSIGPDAEIDFVAQDVGGLDISNLTIVGGTAGVYLEHPLFVSLPAAGAVVPDPIDRYFAEKDNVAGGKTQLIAGGSAIFVTFAPTDKLEIHFKVASAFKQDSAPPPATGGCKQLDKFMAASAQFAPCAACHVGNSNPSAVSSMAIDGYNAAKGTPQLATACAQVLSRVNLVAPDTSGIYIEPDPAKGSNHQFHFNATQFQAFKTAVDVWVQAEKTSP